MLITNPDRTDFTFYLVNLKLKRYLESKKIPIFSVGTNGYYFVKNKTTDREISSISLLDRIGMKYDIVRISENGK